MNNVDQTTKQSWYDLEQSGWHIYSLAYDPSGGSGSETIALANGFTEIYREDTATLVEVVYKSHLTIYEVAALPTKIRESENISFSLTKL